MDVVIGIGLPEYDTRNLLLCLTQHPSLIFLIEFAVTVPHIRCRIAFDSSKMGGLHLQSDFSIIATEILTAVQGFMIDTRLVSFISASGQMPLQLGYTSPIIQ